MGLWLDNYRNGRYCPFCCDGTKLEVEKSPNGHILMRCEECNWIGELENLLKIEEVKNIKRTKLIDKMLECKEIKL